jgi:hypothetical protein
MAHRPIPAVEMIPTSLVTVVNPRVRSKRIFKEIVANIAELGLKRPVTVPGASIRTGRDTSWCAAKAGSKRTGRWESARYPPSSSMRTPRTAWS